MIGVWWHGSERSPEPSIQQAASRIQRVSRRLSRIHVTCRISQDIVRQAGVAEDRVSLLPMGVDVSSFYPPPTAGARDEARAKLGIPADTLVVGSFQKDGSGWGAGETPKWIKGPDVFARVVARLAERHRILALIPGPARGFLKTALQERGVPFRNDGFIPFCDLRPHYYACDMYLMTGRQEGGPAAVLEAPACGVPFVGHRAGMAPDVFVDGQSAFLSDVDDIDDLATKADRVLSSRTLRQRIANEAFAAIRPYAWLEVAALYRGLYASVAAK
jgi:glycosyltransferase involved in cell wall biosynthesis